MSTQSFNASLLDLLPDTIVELYEIDLGEQDGLFRFHPGTISSSNLVFDGRPYFSVPVDASGFEKKGDGKMPRPTLTVANLDGLLSDIIKTRGDLVGFLFIRKRTFLKYIDSENFPNNFNPFSIPDPDARFTDDQFIINKKSQENKFYIEFELISPLEYEGAMLPARTMIANYCPWKYRGSGCRYGQLADFEDQEVLNSTPLNIFESDGNYIGNLGIPVADEKNKLFFEEGGYGLSSIRYRGDYNKTITNYVAGDVVRVRPAIKILSKMGLIDTEENQNNDASFFYVCIQNHSTAKDPRYEKDYWVADQCSRTLEGCKLRFEHYGKYKKGLPFGGFPSIESYKF